MSEVNFDSLLGIMATDLPVIRTATDDTDMFDWTSRYHDDDRCVFLERLGHAVQIAAHEEGRHKETSYVLTDLSRERIREYFEDQLRYGLAQSEVGYTERDIKLVEKYLSEAKGC